MHLKAPLVKILLVSVALFLCVHAYAQKDIESKKKSSYKALKQRSSPNTINDLLSDAEKLKETSPKEALQRVKEALAMSITDQNNIYESRCYNLLGEININISEWKLAFENFRTARDRLFLLKDGPSHPEYIKSVQGMGQSLLELGNFDEALTHLKDLTGLNLDWQVNAETWLQISEVHYRVGNYTQALSSLENIAPRKIADPAIDVRIDNQRAKIYARQKLVDKASHLLNSNISQSRAANSAPAKNEAAEIQEVKEEISNVYGDEGRIDDEINLRQNSIDYNTDIKNYSEVSTDKVELSKALEAKGETSAAIRELEEAAHIADTIGDPKRQSTAYLSLAELYEEHGRPAQAIQTYKKYSEAVGKMETENERRLTEKSDLIKVQRDIEELSKNVAVEQERENLAQAMVSRQRLIIYGLVLIICIIGVTSYFIYKNAVASKTANQLLALKSLRSQMNPHFIFNALNSVNHFVAQNDERTANKFLSEFSRLMRLVLENSQEDFIPLLKEEEIITLYLKLEHYRFRDKFDYEIVMDEQINREAIEIPPMLVQPYIENAVWHGLRYKDQKGFLSVRFAQVESELTITVSDNGIGRKRSAEIKTQNQRKHESTGLKNIRERLGIINKVYKCNYRVKIEDLESDHGTRVTLSIPIQRKSEGHA
jgi:tetratricopeptide (TPR) repeat protein